MALGLPFDVCARGLARVGHVHGRLERVELDGGIAVLDDTYNANPDSMEAALTSLQEIAGARRKLVVLGEMRELGVYEDAGHRQIGAAAAHAGASLVFSCAALGKVYGEAAIAAGLAPSALGIHVVMGEQYPLMQSNQVRNLEQRRVTFVRGAASKPKID